MLQDISKGEIIMSDDIIMAQKKSYLLILVDSLIFFELKKAAILSLTREEFLDFFTNEKVYEKFLDYDVFCKIKNNLDEDSKSFWSNLINYYEGSELYNSSLFSRELVTPSIVIERNPYLEDNNYKK